MPTTYEATVTQTREVVFTFTEKDISSGDTPDVAAEEMALAMGDTLWDEVDFSVVVGPASVEPEES